MSSNIANICNPRDNTLLYAGIYLGIYGVRNSLPSHGNMGQTNKFINIILGISALIGLIYVLAGQEQLGVVGTSDVNNRYMVYFVPDSNRQTKEDDDTTAQHYKDLVDSYGKYVEANLGGKVIHRYTTTLQGLAVELRNTKELAKALSRESVSFNKVTTENVSKIFYNLRKEDLDSWGIKLSVEKDAIMKTSQT